MKTLLGFSKNVKYCISIILLIVASNCFEITVLGQNINFGVQRTFLLEQSQSFDAQFTDPDNSVTTGWRVANLPDIGLEMSGDGKLSGSITYLPVAYPHQINFQVCHFLDCKDQTLLIMRPGLQVMLVLDRSGSMGQKAQSGGTETKWDVLTNSVKNFFKAYEYFQETIDISGYPNPSGNPFVIDSLGVIYFDDHRDDFGSESSLHVYNTIPLPGTKGAMEIDLDGIGPRNLTCLGGAVIAAYNAFDFNSYGRKHIIVFSDGMQNRNPKYDENLKKIWRYGSNPDGFLAGVELDLINLPDKEKKLKIHTFCIGDANLNNLMQSLAAANDDAPGKYHGVITLSEDSYIVGDDLLTGLFNETLKDFSPATVYHEILKIDNRPIEIQFQVNKTSDKLLIKAVGNPKDMKDLFMKVEKDSITLYSKKSEGANNHFFINKKTIDSLKIQIGGNWIVTFTGTKGSKFSATCIVGDEYIDYDCSVNQMNFLPGEPITCSLKVWAGGKPVNQLDKAWVYILKPGDDVNDLFSTTTIPTNIPKDWKSEPGNFAGQDKYEKLIALDSSFVNKLRQVLDSLPMVNFGNNTFTTIFPETKESGVYKFIFKFTGHDDNTGTYERYYMINKVIDFGTADVAKSAFNLKWSLFKKRFEIKPVNQFGHLIGPNRLTNISITVNGEKLKLIDNLDGSYSAKAPCFLLFKKKKEVIVEVKGKILIKIKLGDILRKQK